MPGRKLVRPKHKGCRNGRHYPQVVIRVRDGAVARSTCRICGCDLVRTLASPHWYLSGQLG